MGRRHASHAFMPNKFVFPGGRVDPADCRVEPIADLDPAVRDKLMARMRGTDPGRARGLAMAAIHETFEEVGIIIGRAANKQRPASRSSTWRAFLETGYRPDFRRCDCSQGDPAARPSAPLRHAVFIAEASAAVNLDEPARAASEELLDPYWVTIEEARPRPSLDHSGYSAPARHGLGRPLAIRPGGAPDFPILARPHL